MKRLVLVFLAVGVLIAADGPKEESVQKEKEKLQGLWGVDHDEHGGIPNPQKGVPVFEVTRERFDFYLLEKQGERIVKKAGSEKQATYTLDPTKKPKTIDVTFRTGSDKGKTLRGIYELDGDDLKVAFRFPPEKERPTEFSSEKDDSVQVFFLKRAKPERK
jgi:uncharacterized protein (TIGR03067 family)